jgi:hypothetical protein
MLLVIIVNLLENDCVNQITNLLINKNNIYETNELPFKHNNFELMRCNHPTKNYNSQYFKKNVKGTKCWEKIIITRNGKNCQCFFDVK